MLLDKRPSNKSKQQWLKLELKRLREHKLLLKHKLWPQSKNFRELKQLRLQQSKLRKIESLKNKDLLKKRRDLEFLLRKRQRELLKKRQKLLLKKLKRMQLQPKQLLTKLRKKTRLKPEDF